MERFEVIADFDWLEGEETVGYLCYEQLSGENIYSFEYERKWLQDHPYIMLGTDLQPFSGKQYAEKGKGIFGCFARCKAKSLRH